MGRITHETRHIFVGNSEWVLFESGDPVRLVVFLHGFNGGTLSSWGDLPYCGDTSDWLRHSDMLFIGYDSLREHITATSSRIRTRLADFYPYRYPATTACREHDPEGKRYEELILVGHSLGGLVLRCAIAELGSQLNSLNVAPEPVLSAKLRLFSPAISGFKPAGLIGALSQMPRVDKLIHIALAASPSYQDLQPQSNTIAYTRKCTQQAANKYPGIAAFKPGIVWANPEYVVEPVAYTTDPPPHTIDGQSHTTICKPRKGYLDPLTFLEKGALP